MQPINSCIEESEYKTEFSRREEGKTFTLHFNSPFYCNIVAIDKCVFKNVNLRRCDYLFLVPGKSKTKEINNLPKAYYIELKGDNVKSACEQLFNAIDMTKPQIPEYIIEAKVIGTKGFQPNILNNEYYRKIKRLIKKEITFHKVHKGNNFNYRENLN